MRESIGACGDLPSGQKRTPTAGVHVALIDEMLRISLADRLRQNDRDSL
jgi:hypothetical protein